MSFVYIISNEAIPNCIKIGFTSKDPECRINELYTTSVPICFKAEKIFEFHTDEEGLKAEKYLHRYYAKFRVNDNREFFSSEILKTIEDTVKNKFPKYINKLEKEAEEKRKKEEELSTQRKYENEIKKRIKLLEDKLTYNIDLSVAEDHLHRAFDECSIDEKNKILKEYIDLVQENIFGSRYTDFGYIFEHIKMSSLNQEYVKFVAKHLLEQSVKTGFANFPNLRKDYRNWLMNEYKMDFRNEAFFKGPSENLKIYVIKKRKNSYWEIRNQIGRGKNYFESYLKRIQMNIDCGNIIKQEANQKILNATDLMNIWNELHRISDGTADKEAFEKTILGKTVKLFKKIW